MKKLTKKQIKRAEKRAINKQFKEWSHTVKVRDGFKCVVCESNQYLNSHHLISRKNKELRFDIDNGLTLCAKHHLFDMEISAHKNSFPLIIWLMINRPEQFNKLKNYILNKNVSNVSIIN